MSPHSKDTLRPNPFPLSTFRPPLYGIRAVPDDPQPHLDEVDFGPTLRGHREGDRVFERFVLVRMISRGGMGVVWLAKDERLSREVVLKFMPETVRFDDAALEELKNETRQGLVLNHPNIVKMFDFILDDNDAAICMEFIGGETLAKLRVQQPGKVFAPATLEPLLEQLLDGLQYAHETARIVHRDLKPANLMLDSSGTLKIMDFGIARSIADSMLRTTLGSPTQGTLAYMSPQQTAGKPACVADDVYALGATLYELLSGKPPFYTGNLPEQIRSVEPPTIALRRKEFGITGDPVPEAWERVVAACLAKDPAARPPDMEAVRQMFTESPMTAVPSAHIPETASALHTEKRHGPAMLVIGAVLFFLFLGLLIGGSLLWNYLRIKPASNAAVTSVESVEATDADSTGADKDTSIIHVPAMFATLQQAVQVAKQGSVIEIQAGTYDGPIRLKSGIRLRATGTVVLQSDGSHGSVLVAENCTDILLENLLLEHAGDASVDTGKHPVLLLENSSVELRNCILRKGTGSGVLITGPGTSILRKCTAHYNAGSGIQVERGASVRIEQGESSGNAIAGIAAYHTGTNLTLEENRCANNGHAGIVFEEGASGVLRTNVTEANGRAGIALMGSGVSVEIHDHTSAENATDGIIIQDGAVATLKKNIIRNNLRNGIVLHDASQSTVLENNRLESNAGNGIAIATSHATPTGDGAIRILGNTTTGHAKYGILVIGPLSPEIHGNTVSGNGLAGIAAIEGATPFLINNPGHTPLPPEP